MASTIAVWTEHENKTIHDGTNETPSVDTTMIMYRTVGTKYITGIYLPSLLLKNGSNFPQWKNEYQSVTSSGQNTGFQAGAITNWAVKSSFQNSSPDTNRLLLAGTTGSKITTTDYKSTLANFGNTSFSIGSGLQVATGTGTLHSNVATDKLAELTVNDFSAVVSSVEWNPSVLDSYKDETTPFDVLWSGGATNSNTFTLKETPGLEFNTTHWGTGSDDGIKLIDIGIFDGTKCVGINTGEVTTNSHLPNITWNDTSTKSRWDPNTWGGDTADIAFPTNQGENGFSPGNNASCYIRLNNTNLATTNSNVVEGDYILKVDMAPWTFLEEIISIQRNFSLTNMSISFTATNQPPGNENKGAKVQLQWNVTGGLNRVYQQTDATYLTNTSGSDTVIFTENIRRLRTDTATVSQDVLYLGSDVDNAISILPEKIMTNGSRSIVDNYGLWFNASYTYYIDAYNVITGDTITNKTTTVTTAPGTPINWQEAQVAEASINPSIQMEWENPPATGTAVTTIKYNITRATYNGSGVDISDNTTVINFSGFNALAASNLTALNYTTTANETLLYGKTFTYQLLAHASGTSTTITNSFTVPDDSGTNASLNYTIDVSQNAVGTINQISDYQDIGLTYQHNYFVITVPTDYTFSDGSQPTQYQIFEKYKLIATIPKTKVDASGNQIIFSRYWLNGGNASITTQYNTGVFYNVVAADPDNNRYSAIGDTKYAKTLGQPKLPYPMPVTNMTATGSLNQITLNWSLPDNSTNPSEPTTYNYIHQIHIYAIINTDPTVTDGHYDHATDTSYDFAANPPAAANNAGTNYYTLKANITNANTTSWSTGRNLWDNEIVGYRIVTSNSQGLFSGQDPNDPASGNLLWGTTLDISGVSYREAVVSQDFYEFDNTYVQAKTLGPAPATGVSIGGGVGSNNINPSWSPTGTYSTDSPLGYSAFYVYNSTLGAGDLIPSDSTNGVLIAVPEANATGVNLTTSKNILNLVPGSQYTVSVSVYTNMQATHADPNNWTAGADSPQIKQYTTGQNTVNTSNYAVEGVDSAHNVAIGFDIPVEMGHPVYQDDFAGNNLTWKVPQYNAFPWKLNGDGVTRTTPVHMISIWRFSSQGVNKGTKMTFEPSDSLVIDGYTMVNGDVIAVYDVQHNWCVDSYVWDNTSNAATRALLSDNEKLGGQGFMFQLWKSTSKTVHTLYVTSYDLDESPGGGTYTSNDNISPTTQLTTINGGTNAAEYKNLKFAMADINYKIYHKGVYKGLVTNVLTYDTSTLADTDKNNYDVTWYYSVQSGHSPKSSTAFTSESRKWTLESATGLLVELPRVITISNPIKSSVIYNAQDSSDLVLGNSGSQTFTFNSGEWYRVSFYVVDTTLTTVRTLFETIPNLGSNDSILINNFTSDSFKYNYLEPGGRESGWTGSDDEDIHYDLGYDIKIVTDDGASRSWTISGISGKQIQGINQKYLQGWSNMGHPYSQAKTGQHVLIDKTSTSNENIYSKLVIIWSPSNNSVSGPYYPVFYDPNTSLPRTTPDYSKVDTTNYIYGTSTIGVMNFDPGSYYKLRMSDELIILIGSLQSRRNKGDFNNDDSVDINDAYSLAKYLVEINPEYEEIAGAIISESSDKDNHNWANLKSDTGSIDGGDNNPLINPDLRDLVYLISHIDQITGYTSL